MDNYNDSNDSNDNYDSSYNNSSNTPDPYQPDNYNRTPGQGTPIQPVNPTNNMAVASMIVGIFGLITCCMPPLQFILGVVGLLLVFFSKKGKPWSGFAIAGLVMSILSLLISVAMVCYIAFAYRMMKDPQFAPIFNDIYQMYETIPVQ